MPLGRVYVPPPTRPQLGSSNGYAKGNGGYGGPQATTPTNGHIVPKSAPVFRNIEIKVERPPTPPLSNRIVEINIVREADHNNTNGNNDDEVIPNGNWTNHSNGTLASDEEVNNRLNEAHLDDSRIIPIAREAPNIVTSSYNNTNCSGLTWTDENGNEANDVEEDEAEGAVEEEPPVPQPAPVAVPIKRYEVINDGFPNHAKGLKNLGNTCYMNSIIQCLVHTRSLLDFLKTVIDDKAEPIKGAQPAAPKKSWKITRAFARLADDMWRTSSNNHGVAEPSSFRREMGSFAPRFMGYEQHDSQEFLTYALDGLHTELNRVEKPVKKEPNNNETENADGDSSEDPETSRLITYKDIEEPGIGAEEKGERCWKFYLQKDDSFITDMFLGQFRSTLRCTVCQHDSVTFEPFWVVSLPLAKTTTDLNASFELFVTPETLDGDEKPTCEECKERRKCTKWYAFERWPEYLVVHLKRFSPTSSYRGKLSNLVETPLDYLNLSSFSSDYLGGKSGARQSDTNVIYECYGVSNHSGGLHGGHYTAACRHPTRRGRWHMYNDRAVSGMSPDHVVSAEAYLLFFQRVRPSSDTHEESYHNGEDYVQN